LNPNRTEQQRRAWWPAGLLVLLMATGGGGCSPSARPSDPSEGRKALQAVLDAWKGGAKPDSLALQNPSIHASDGDWASGLALRDYRADGEARLVGSDLNYSVVLELKGSRGRVTKKTAVYAVTTHPMLMVLRQDE
jgi:hypothetical protein